MAEWDYKLFWDESISQLRQELGEGEFTIWLSNLDYLKATETEIAVSVPSVFFQEKFREIRNVLYPLAEGRQVDWKYIKPVV